MCIPSDDISLFPSLTNIPQFVTDTLNLLPSSNTSHTSSSSYSHSTSHSPAYESNTSHHDSPSSVSIPSIDPITSTSTIHVPTDVVRFILQGS